MEQNAPSLRFPGFSGEWEKKKLGEIVQRKSKKGISDFQTPSVEYEDINAKEGTLNKNIYNKMIGKEGILFDKDDIIYGKLRPYLGNWINPTFTGVAVGDFWVLKPKAKLAKGFLYYLIQGTKFQKIANQSTGTKMPRADWKLIVNAIFAFPSLPEQEKIADFFTALDAKIDLKEKEIEDVKSMKKGFLQKMFPQDGESVPCLRFPGFSGEWEKKALGEILKICHGRDYKELNNGTIPVLGTGGVITYVDKYLCNWACALIGRKGTINQPRYMDKPFWAVDTLFYSEPFSNQSPKFQYYLFETIPWEKYNEASGVPSLTASTIEKISKSIPSLPEQEKIADFFSALDEKVNAMEKQLEDLKEMKKGFLQQMFI